MAPIASKLLDFITNLAGFIAKLFETHPAIAQVAGVMGILGGVFSGFNGSDCCYK